MGRTEKETGGMLWRKVLTSFYCLKLNFTQYSAIQTIYSYQTAPFQTREI